MEGVKKVDLLVCKGCNGLLSGAYFSCLLCLGKGNDTFDLCCGCYRGGNIAHVHPTSYLLDHHSLLSVLRQRATETEKTERKKEMEKLQEIAEAHYRAGSKEVQALANGLYESMDADGDGRVDCSEFLAFMKQEGYWEMRNPQFFRELDQDGNGSLDFSEVMTLYYIIKSGRPFCDGCGYFIPGIFFSCVKCFKPPKTSFNLCGDCYRSAKCSHSHDGRSQLLDNYTLLEATRNLGLAQVTGASYAEGSPIPANADIPAAHNYHSSYPMSAVPAPFPIPTPFPNYANEIVPYTPNKLGRKVALKALEMAIAVGNISATMCTIL